VKHSPLSLKKKKPNTTTKQIP